MYAAGAAGVPRGIGASACAVLPPLASALFAAWKRQTSEECGQPRSLEAARLFRLLVCLEAAEKACPPAAAYVAFPPPYNTPSEKKARARQAAASRRPCFFPLGVFCARCAVVGSAGAVPPFAGVVCAGRWSCRRLLHARGGKGRRKRRPVSVCPPSRPFSFAPRFHSITALVL